MRQWASVIFIGTGLSFCSFPVMPSYADEDFFESNIRPLLATRCFECHGAEKSKGGLRLDSLKAILAGGDSGEPALVAGDTSASLMVEAVRYGNESLQMPPERRLAREEIADLEKWVELGAPWPGFEEKTRDQSLITDEDRSFWSFQPVRRPAVPGEKENWPVNQIDRFVQQKMRMHGLTASHEAESVGLVRRLYFDLTGLPPMPEEVNAFVNDQSPGAWAKLVDRLLESPQYGERWGRHWLDVARYADTQGDVADYPIPWAWKYRNWVFQAIEEDLPIDEFLRWQIAGDLIARHEPDDVRFRDQLIATGFISLSRRFGQFSTGKDHLVIEDTIDTLGRGMLGLTLRCARCHNHKFDPISARDYYALYGIFESTQYPTAGNSTDRMPKRLVAVSRDPEKQRGIDEYWSEVERQHKAAGQAGAPRNEALFKKYEELKKKEDGEALEAFLKENELLRDAFEHGPKWPKERWAKLLQNPPETEMVFSVVDRPEPMDARFQRFGQPENLGMEVPRRVIEVIAGSNPEPADGESGRLQLADWIVDPGHPLTARVFVNRVWQWHFGEGLVRTPDNFGNLGEPPTHPELLDWLTWTFVNEDDWSLRKLHRRILLSRTYRQSSDPTPDSLRIDPDNLWLSHFSRRRLDAEAIRDAMLFASGELDLTPGMEHPFTHHDGSFFRQYTLNYPFDRFFENDRRSCYQLVARLHNHPVFGLFDGPDRNQSTSKRTSSDTATQALFLMNSPWIQERARAFARRLIADTRETDDRIRLGVQYAWGREPLADEMRKYADFVGDYRENLEARGEEAAYYWAMVAFCRVLLTANEFFFVD